MNTPSAEITSPANPRLKALQRLRRRRDRDQARATLVDGVEEVELAALSGAAVRELYWCPDLLPRRGQAVRDELAGRGVPTVRLSRVAFEKIAYRESPDGMLALVSSPGADGSLHRLAVPADALVLVGEHVEKPGNLGAMLRTADAAGADAVLAADPVTDWGNPNVVRASKGTVFSVPVATATTADVLDWVTRHAITLVATTPDTDVDYADVDYTGPVAIAVGAEKTGLGAAMLERADVRVRIPMTGRVNSLNLATSAAIVLYEAVRQRRRSDAAPVRDP